MKCPCCNKEMKEGFLYASKDGAFSFSDETPGTFTPARKAKGFVKITQTKVGGRACVKANICEDCREVVFNY